MGKGAYFFIHAFWSVIYATLFWFMYMYNATSGSSDETLSLILNFGGPGLYLLITIIFIALGAKKVSGWKAWMVIFVFIISIAMAIAGFFLTSYVSVYLCEWFGIAPFTDFKLGLFGF